MASPCTSDMSYGQGSGQIMGGSTGLSSIEVAISKRQ